MESMSAAPTGCLPAEITEEILIKLPVKSLLRFKCVCKRWRSLITSRRFIGRHYSDDSNQSCLLIRISGEYSIHNASNHPRIKESDLLQQMPPRPVRASFLRPENGVFCFDFGYGRIFLSNPAMRELRLLPPTPFPLNGYHPGIGFGFDPSTGDHKVVVSGWVYTPRTDSWKNIETDKSKVWCFGTTMYKAFLNGVYYWCLGYLNYLSDASGIVAFDMRTERFEEIHVPDCIRFSVESPRRVIEYGDSIALQSCSRYDDYYDGSVCDDLWVRGKDGSWSKRKIVLWVRGKDGCWSRRKNDLAIEERCEVEARLKTHVHSYQDSVDVYSYRESLVSIKGGGDAAFLQDLFHGRISEY